ncbi:hypothetical protein GYMLUDRAFT_198945 [Collybiopsis luxurians FD-317 M1]|uniref:RhoGAP-domain-containing protein n=1 Tax=Collybiopsis luxurians FD-317 M1 TaxID=944289 RepID=A0A0D0CYS1_9AGAR|nr:hypothetical protein GYMLUDRAFT_198945 [Collybiopsis luxurians FD-317 M1]
MPASSPSRERDNRQPFPHTPSPHRQTTLPAASSSSSNLPATANPTTLTLDSLLSLHSSSSDPKLAALDQALSERNILSSQNSQLWKLIEKQRSGYNQIMKELERVRNERDTYKARLAVTTGGNIPPEKRMPSRERSAKQSLDSSVSEAERDQNPRQNMTRYYSDDQVTPRTTAHHLHATRSQEPISANQSTSSLVTSATSSSTSLNTSHSRLPPLTVPPRSDALPELSATQETPPQSFNTVTPKYSHFAHGYNDSIVSSISYTSSSSNHNYSSSSKPYPRKSSFTESISSVSTNGADGGAAYSGIAHYPSQNTPQTAPAEYSSNPLYTPVNSSAMPPQILTSVPTPTATDRDRHTSPTSSKPSNNGNLSSLSPAMAVPLSRDSRISLPDEAKQYIANMGDSPVPSPRMEMFSKAPSALSQSYVPTSPGPDKEFLDMEEEEEEDEEEDEDEDEDDEEGDQKAEAPEDDYEVVEASATSASAPVSNPASTISFESSQSTGPSAGSASSTQAPARSSSSNPNRPHLGDYPLPPSSMSPQHDEARAEAAYQRHLTADINSAQRSNDDLFPQRLDTQNLLPNNTSAPSPAGFFRALPLLSTDLPHTKITVSHSFVRPNDRGKEVLSFVVHVDPGKGKDGWKVEKMYSDVLNLDQRVRNSVGKTVGKKIVQLPEGKLWKDHAPAKADQRKAVLETYLQTLVNLPVKNNDEVIAFFTTDIVKETMQPVLQAGHKEGYLTKRGKNFGGWKTRYFVLAGPVLEYFDTRGGTHLGSITVAGAQIGRQQRTNTSSSTDEEKEYRHAFLIVEAKKGPGGNHPRHVLCAESDEDRDSWVEILVRYFTGTYTEEPVAYGITPSNAAAPQQNQPANGASSSGTARASMSSAADPVKKPSRGFSKDDIPAEKRAIPLSQLPQDASNAKLFSRPSQDDYNSYANPSPSPSKPITVQGQTERERLQQGGQPSSLPDSSPLSNPPPMVDPGQRANSEMGHYPDIQTLRAQQQRQSPDIHRSKQQHSNHGSSPVGTAPSDRIPSPDKMDVNGKVKISGPMNGAPIPAGYKFGGKDATPTLTDGNGGGLATSSSSNDRREKAKSRSFWGFGRPGGDKSSNTAPPSATFVPRAVFGVSLEESLDIAQIANLPAIVFRCIEYLEAKKADQEEGIYRLSGSSAVIKSLKDRFNAEGDVHLLASDEYWDPHAIAGLLKSFLRELPSSILTRDLHMRFLAVIDFVDAQERIRELSQLIASLPIANYSLLRALTAHLILIVQNSAVNKMTMRNVGIVFSPTLGIPAGVFSLMLGEFNRVFNVDAGDQSAAVDSEMVESDRRNSVQYSEAAADKLLGLSGRSLTTPAEEAQSDTDESSIHGDESGTDPEMTNESSGESPGAGVLQDRLSPPDTPLANNLNSKAGRASNKAAERGLNISVSDRGHRYSRIMGLPTSPRPPPSPGSYSPASSSSPAH